MTLSHMITGLSHNRQICCILQILNGDKKIKQLPEFDTSSMSLPSRISSSFWAADTAQFTPK